MGSRTERLAPDKLERIILNAAKEFSSYGYEGASLNRILAASGVSKGYAYYYFTDKADLFALLVKEYWSRHVELMDFNPAELALGEFWETLTSMYQRSSVLQLRNPWMIGFSKSLYSLPHAVKGREDVLALMREYDAFLRTAISRGQQLGLVRTDMPIEFLMALATGIEEVFDHWSERAGADETEEDSKEFARLGVDLVKRLFERRDSEG